MGLGWYERVISLNGQQTGKARSNRKLMLAISLMAISTPLFLILSRSWSPLMMLINFFTVAGGLPPLFFLLACRPLPQRAVQWYACMITTAILLMDFRQRVLLYPGLWPFVVLIADAALFMQLGTRFASILMCAVSVWVVCMSVEGWLRLGLFDLPGTTALWHRRERVQETNNCDTPPCATTLFTAFWTAFISLWVLLIDFRATHGFADAAAQEQEAMLRTISTIETVAQLLAGYDVDTVAQMLDEAEAEGRLPTAMHAALRRLEENLRVYRPYLPEALFEQDTSEEAAYVRHMSWQEPPCCTLSKEATIVFTDVRSSTAIWEAVPEAMKKAMQVHSAVMRRGIAKLGGYEVKTIGDAFMVAFEEVRAGVDFGLTVQQGLFDAEWPAALREILMYGRTDLWGGLTVRIGVNHGPVTIETNQLTRRADYFGHTVNVAARLEGVRVPGAVTVPGWLWAQVCDMCLPAVAGPEWPANLKGVSAPVVVCNVWPARLAGRENSDPPTVCVANESFGSRSLPSSMRLVDATIGTLCTSQGCSASLNISTALEAVLPLLQQSRGMLVTLLGDYLFVGWNLVQPVPGHAENAVQFAQRVGRAAWASDTVLSLTSGKVHHGDVGTSTQRFVTASGQAVCDSVRVWCLAHQANLPFLYMLCDGNPSGRLQAMLRRSSLPCPADIGTLYELTTR